MRTTPTDEERERYAKYKLTGITASSQEANPGVEKEWFPEPLKKIAKAIMLAPAVVPYLGYQAYKSLTQTMPEMMDEAKRGEYDPIKVLDAASWGMGGAGGALGAGSKSTGAGVRAAAERFYSPLERALETGQVGKLTIPENPKVSGLQSTLKHAADKNIISPEELEYSGLLNRLAELSGGDRVSRQELLEFVKQRSLKETGEPSVLESAPRGFMTRNDLPGAEFARYGPENMESINLPGGIPGTYQERLFHFKPEGGLRYVEPHDWPGNVAENAFLFTRGHDRKLPTGQTIKLIEEAQSTLHQQAAKEGYATPGFNSTQLENIRRQGHEAWGRHIDEYMSSHSGPEAINEVAYTRWVLEHYPEDGRLMQARVDLWNSQKSGIPKAPFVKDWPKLALKEWVDTAIREGKDGVGWSTGKILAERYNKLANSFEWMKVGDTYTLTFETPAGRTFTKQYKSIDDISKNATNNVAKIVQEQETNAVHELRQPPKLKIKKVSDTRYDILNEDNQVVNMAGSLDHADFIIRNTEKTADQITGPGAKGDFLVGGEFFEKIYDKEFVKHAEREYGVTPKKVALDVGEGLSAKYDVVPIPTETMADLRSQAHRIRVVSESFDSALKDFQGKVARGEVHPLRPEKLGEGYGTRAGDTRWSLTDAAGLDMGYGFGTTLGEAIRCRRFELQADVAKWHNKLARIEESLTDKYILWDKANNRVAQSHYSTSSYTGKTIDEVIRNVEKEYRASWEAPNVEIWHLPFTEGMKTRILSEGQRIAQGAPGVGSTIRGLTEKDFYKREDDQVNKTKDRANEIINDPEYHKQLKELERKRQERLRKTKPKKPMRVFPGKKPEA